MVMLFISFIFSTSLSAAPVAAALEALDILCREPERVRRMLEGITASQAVWHVEAGVYVPVEVLAEESGFRERGTLRSMELVIRHEEYEEV